jgi:Cu(I)/Ag(I) efflux system membrane fusion protein
MKNEANFQTSSETKSPRREHRFILSVVVPVVVAGGAVIGGAYWLGHAVGKRHAAAERKSASAPKARYQCPMHPSIVLDHPGECPICGMKLVKLEEPMGAGTQASATGISYADEASVSSSPVQGQATVAIDPARQQLIGLTTAPVTAGPVGGAWRTVGRVAVDETRVRHINVKIPVFVERIYVDFVGKAVRKGDPLFAVYSPELVSAQEEYLLALQMQRSLQKGHTLTNDADALVAAARRKMSLWDIPDAEIDRIASTGEATKTLIFYSPVSGVVTKKDVVEGMKLEAGAMPYEIVDLSTVWVLADVYESELRLIKEGMPATLTLNAFPNREFDGKVLFMDPLLDPSTRTVKVRLAFRNPSGDLRPEMFGEVVLKGEPREGLRILQDAVIDSGTEKIVFVSLGNGKFEPRIVWLGDSSGNEVEVVSGLKNGEQVVTRANFLIDSESKLRASLQAMPPPHKGHRP